ncbi:MAG TPA: MBL fold metallo-hydrolase [Thermoanaerobaculia bacterium]|nr:MBL fold metallo-hydrolase [Thermoanaerobaculia bacterium]
MRAALVAIGAVAALVLVPVVTFGGIELIGQPPRSHSEAGARFEVVLIGTGIPLANPQRGTAATLVLAGEHAVLVDAGRNAFAGLAAASAPQPTLVLFTHYHSDHIAGFPELLVGRGIAGATEPLPVIGPPGAERVVAGFAEAYALEQSYRVAHHGEHWSAAGASAAVTEAEPGVVLDREGLRITMFEVDHDPVPAVGYRFDFDGRSVVISGDTKKVAKLVEIARAADLLVHEAVDRRMIEQRLPMIERANPRQFAMTHDMLEHHTSTLEVAEIARDAGVGKLVLTHLVPSIPPTDAAEESFARGMSEIYSGPIVVGRDGTRIVVE